MVVFYWLEGGDKTYIASALLYELFPLGDITRLQSDDLLTSGFREIFF